MTDTLMNALSSVVGPLLRRPKRLQVAALCLKGEGSGKQVLMITSRDTGRWVLPKGWPIDGYDAPGSALQEAWEEAGVKEAEIDPDMIGTYEYAKRLTGEIPVLFFREGDTSDELLALIDEEPSISLLVLGADTQSETSGPLISFLTSRGASLCRVPITIVPGNLSDGQLDALF